MEKFKTCLVGVKFLPYVLGRESITQKDTEIIILWQTKIRIVIKLLIFMLFKAKAFWIFWEVCVERVQRKSILFFAWLKCDEKLSLNNPFLPCFDILQRLFRFRHSCSVLSTVVMRCLWRSWRFLNISKTFSRSEVCRPQCHQYS